VIWLASYPRSGNAFVRNLLYEVYGLESSEYHDIEGYPFDSNYTDYPFVKTHILPTLVKPDDPTIKTVYLVPDGRDSVVSMAHQRKDIIAPDSDFYENMKEAIIAQGDSFFGGWSKNVEAWAERADLIIRYEDLVNDPIGQMERIRMIYDLPAPDKAKIPSFQSMKKGNAKYGTRKSWGYNEEESIEFADKSFRKGKSGGWKADMPDDLHDLFWINHGACMTNLGYSRDGESGNPDPEFNRIIYDKLGLPEPPKARKTYKVLIEANKMATPDNDGVKRYISGIINSLIPLAENMSSKWSFDLLINKEVISLKKYAGLRKDEIAGEQLAKKYGLASKKHRKGVFGRLEEIIRFLLPDRWARWLAENDINIFHKLYYNSRTAVLYVYFLLRSMVLFIPRWGYTIFLRNRQKKEGYSIPGINSTYDLIHVPLQQHYLPFVRATAPMVFTIHDFTHKLFPEYHTSINIKNAENGLKFIEKKQIHVINVSSSTLNDSKKFLTLPDEKQHLIYEHVEEEKFIFQVENDENTDVLKKYGIRLDMPYILILGTIEPRKNVSNSIKAFQLLHKKHKGLKLALVISGKQGWKAKSLTTYSNLITFTGFVDDDDLPALYARALALSYVSHYEGFGLPILEAMRCGTPVIYGDNSSMPEVAGEGGLRADPDKVEDICDKYEQIVLDNGLRNELARKAMKESLKFSSRKSVSELLEVYENIIELSKKKINLSIV